MKRQWSGDDIVEIVFPYRLRFTSVDQKRPELVALSYGPIVLVSDEMTLLVGDKEHPENWIVPVEGSALTFRTLPGHTGALYKVCRTFTPYYTYPENKWYFMYHRIYPSAVTQKEAVRLANM